jgi:hypothetical protein
MTAHPSGWCMTGHHGDCRRPDTCPCPCHTQETTP